MKRFFFILLLQIVSTPAHGTVYTWKDSTGAANFTNRQDEIPARYRSKAKLLYPELGDPASARQNTPPDQAATETAPQPSAAAAQAVPTAQRPAQVTPPQQNNSSRDASRQDRRAPRAKRTAGVQEE